MPTGSAVGRARGQVLLQFPKTKPGGQRLLYKNASRSGTVLGGTGKV